MSVRNQLNDPDLPEEERDRILGSFVRQHENELLRKKYAEVLAEQYGVTRSTDNHKRDRGGLRILRWQTIAAIAAAFILTISVWYFRPAENANDLLADYLSVERVDQPLMRGGIAESELLRDFEAGNYAAAAARTDINDPQLSAAERYFGGLSYLQLERSEEAVALLSSIEPGQDYAEEAKWYLILLELREGNQEKAIAQLKEYRAGDYYYSRAQRLLGALE